MILEILSVKKITRLGIRYVVATENANAEL